MDLPVKSRGDEYVKRHLFTRAMQLHIYIYIHIHICSVHSYNCTGFRE